MDKQWAEVSLWICTACDQWWLRYYYVVEAFSKSGRWYLGAITADQAAILTAEQAKDTLERLAWYYYGGSYYDGQIGKAAGDIFLYP
jgi:hypothetical protein